MSYSIKKNTLLVLCNVTPRFYHVSNNSVKLVWGSNDWAWILLTSIIWRRISIASFVVWQLLCMTIKLTLRLIQCCYVVTFVVFYCVPKHVVLKNITHNLHQDASTCSFMKCQAVNGNQTALCNTGNSIKVLFAVRKESIYDMTYRLLIDIYIL